MEPKENFWSTTCTCTVLASSNSLSEAIFYLDVRTPSTTALPRATASPRAAGGATPSSGPRLAGLQLKVVLTDAEDDKDTCFLKVLLVDRTHLVEMPLPRSVDKLKRRRVNPSKQLSTHREY